MFETLAYKRDARYKTWFIKQETLKHEQTMDLYELKHGQHQPKHGQKWIYMNLNMGNISQNMDRLMDLYELKHGQHQPKHGQTNGFI